MAGGETEILARDGNPDLLGSPRARAGVRRVPAIRAIVQDGLITDATATDPIVTPHRIAEFCRHHRECGFHVTALVIVSDKLVAVEAEPLKRPAPQSVGVARVV